MDEDIPVVSVGAVVAVLAAASPLPWPVVCCSACRRDLSSSIETRSAYKHTEEQTYEGRPQPPQYLIYGFVLTIMIAQTMAIQNSDL